MIITRGGGGRGDYNVGGEREMIMTAHESLYPPTHKQRTLLTLTPNTFLRGSQFCRRAQAGLVDVDQLAKAWRAWPSQHGLVGVAQISLVGVASRHGSVGSTLRLQTEQLQFLLQKGQIQEAGSAVARTMP